MPCGPKKIRVLKRTLKYTAAVRIVDKLCVLRTAYMHCLINFNFISHANSAIQHTIHFLPIDQKTIHCSLFQTVNSNPHY